MVRPGRGEVEQIRLVNKALAYLPIPKPVAPDVVADFGALGEPEVTDAFSRLGLSKNGQRILSAEHPTRVLANALINIAWRIGPVEDIHAGSLSRGYPLDMRRI